MAKKPNRKPIAFLLSIHSPFDLTVGLPERLSPALQGISTNMDVSFTLPRSETECAVEATVAVIGGKWKPILLFHLTSGAKKFSDLQRLLPQASDRMMTRSLRELEADGLIERIALLKPGARLEYSLTKCGQSLIPILNAMSSWGANRV